MLVPLTISVWRRRLWCKKNNDVKNKMKGVCLKKREREKKRGREREREFAWKTLSLFQTNGLLSSFLCLGRNVPVLKGRLISCLTEPGARRGDLLVLPDLLYCEPLCCIILQHTCRNKMKNKQHSHERTEKSLWINKAENKETTVPVNYSMNRSVVMNTNYYTRLVSA